MTKLYSRNHNKNCKMKGKIVEIRRLCIETGQAELECGCTIIIKPKISITTYDDNSWIDNWTLKYKI